jgi:nucleotide-binding universal stress UspA family protein
VQHTWPRKIVAAVDPFHSDGQYEGFNDRILREASILASTCNTEFDVIDVEVIVTGRVGNRGLGRLVGGTVEHLRYRMPCSVWVVSPE